MIFLKLALLVLASNIYVTAAYRTSTTLSYCKYLYCGINAVCNPNTLKCECPSDKPCGRPNFKCAECSEMTCTAFSDPLMEQFSKEVIDVKTPCLLKATDLDFGQTCKLNVYFNNGISAKGNYYIKSMYLRLTTRSQTYVRKGSSAQTVTIEITINSEGVHYTNINDGGVQRIDTTDKSYCVSNGEKTNYFTACFADNTEAWVLKFPGCNNTEITFRPGSSIIENQEKRPGFMIETPASNDTIPRSGALPKGLCNSPDSVYDLKGICDEMGYKDLKLCILHILFLKTDTSLQPPECKPTIDEFQEVHDDYKLEVIKRCGSILTEYSHCAAFNGYAVLDVFGICMAVVVGESDDHVSTYIHGPDAVCNSYTDPVPAAQVPFAR